MNTDDTSPDTAARTAHPPATAGPPADGPESARPDPLTLGPEPPALPAQPEPDPSEPPARPAGATAITVADADDGRRARGLRMRTVVLGLVLLVVSGTSLLRLLTDVRVDDTVVLLTLLIVAGALLLGGGVASAAREARAGRRRL
jgi:hypothetical protein